METISLEELKDEAFSLEELKDVAVCSYELEFCPTRDADCSDVVGIVVIKDENVTIAAGGRDKEGAGLVRCYMASGCKA